jgi:hypothetical protein
MFKIMVVLFQQSILNDGWSESEKCVFQVFLSMVVVKNSRCMVGEIYINYGRIWHEKR